MISQEGVKKEEAQNQENEKKLLDSMQNVKKQTVNIQHNID